MGEYDDAIPSDYDGVMGVPISFLNKYNPDQFKVLGITQSWDDPAGLKTKIYPTQVQVSAKGVRSQVKKLNDGGAIRVTDARGVTHYEVDGGNIHQAVLPNPYPPTGRILRLRCAKRNPPTPSIL